MKLKSRPRADFIASPGVSSQALRGLTLSVQCAFGTRMLRSTGAFSGVADEAAMTCFWPVSGWRRQSS
jgi:hypothetical protein